jgi:hypothetical protein
MVFRDDVDVSTVNWANQAQLTRRYAESLPHGWRRNAAIDRALACEAIAHSRNLLLHVAGNGAVGTERPEGSALRRSRRPLPRFAIIR